MVPDSGPCYGSGVVLTESSGTVMSERYQEDGSGDYVNHADCTWMIQTPPGQVRTKTLSYLSYYCS